MEFDYENTWSPYRELALTPSITLFWDKGGYKMPAFKCITIHFLAWKFGITFSSK